MNRSNLAVTVIGVLLALIAAMFSPAFSGLAFAADAVQYSPPVTHPHPNQVFWGDTHLHTNLSADAFSIGNHTVSPQLAYRFARGETVTSQTGIAARLARPLDFLLIADHAEFLGVLPKVFNRSADVMNTHLGRRWVGYLDGGEPLKVLTELGIIFSGALTSGNLQPFESLEPPPTPELLQELHGVDVPVDMKRSIWSRVGELADEFNEPGRFTAFIGYEWSSMPDGNNLHRNLLFRDDASMTSEVVPYSALDSSDPEDLWRFMAGYEAQTGGQVLAIPHNGNLSNGLMFAETTFGGKPLTRDYAERRARWEPIIEVTQIKGDGETHPLLSPNDEFADFETWDKANLTFSPPKKEAMLEFEYARAALKNGLVLAQSLGANPYPFGMIGSTDSHTGLATGDEDNFFGKFPLGEPAVDRANKDYYPGSAIETKTWAASAAGYAAVWARENTREALFDAMQRRETYATTGPRIVLRFFGGWSFAKGDHQRSDFARHGYLHGVPMGGQLLPGEKGAAKAPSFLVSALKDPIGANLDRIQIVKGWADAEGNAHEKVYNVSASGGRKIQGNRLKPVGSTVDVDNAGYRNSIGDASLSTVWQDPEFDPCQPAFYYVRVLEIPTPRWPTIDAKVLGGTLPKGAPMAIQERAYTSPIWYWPQG